MGGLVTLEWMVNRADLATKRPLGTIQISAAANL
jgi:hypothetical protein